MDQQPDANPDPTGDAVEYEVGMRIARETMVGDLRDLMLDVFRDDMNAAWKMLREDQQRAVIDRISQRARAAVGRIARIIAADGQPTLTATVDQVVVKDGLKVVLKLPKTVDSLHHLGMGEGNTCLIWVGNTGPYQGERAPAEPDHDQPSLGLSASDVDGDTDDEAGPDMAAIDEHLRAEDEAAAEGKPAEIIRSCDARGLVEFKADDFGAHGFAFGPAQHGGISAHAAAKLVADRHPDWIIYVAPGFLSRPTEDHFTLSLLDGKGQETSTVVVRIMLGHHTGAAAGNGAAEHPNGSANGDAAQQSLIEGAGEDPAPPPPPARKRAGGRRRPAH